MFGILLLMPGIASIALAALISLSVGQEKDDDYSAYGQSWQTVEKTRHYKIYSMLGGTLTEKIGIRQEKIFEKYRQVFPKKKFPAAHDDKIFPVLVFETRGEYEVFSKANGFDPARAHAYYSPFHKYTVLWYADDKTLINVLFHEAFHQFLDHALPGAKGRIPSWVNEGLAGFFEGAKWDGEAGEVSIDPKDMTVTDINQTRKAMLTGSEIGLEKLFTASHKEFHEEEKESLYYSEGLSAVYFLIYGMKKRKGIKLLVKYFKVLDGGKSSEEAYKKVFKKQIKRLEKDWRKLILNMKL